MEPRRIPNEHQDTVIVFINRGKKLAAYVFSEVGPS